VRTRVVHALLSRHAWVGSGAFRIVYYDTLRVAVEREECDCGASRWMPTYNAALWHVRDRPI